MEVEFCSLHEGLDKCGSLSLNRDLRRWLSSAPAAKVPRCYLNGSDRACELTLWFSGITQKRVATKVAGRLWSGLHQLDGTGTTLAEFAQANR